MLQFLNVTLFTLSVNSSTPKSFASSRDCRIRVVGHKVTLLITFASFVPQFSPCLAVAAAAAPAAINAAAIFVGDNDAAPRCRLLPGFMPASGDYPCRNLGSNTGCPTGSWMPVGVAYTGACMAVGVAYTRAWVPVGVAWGCLYRSLDVSGGSLFKSLDASVGSLELPIDEAGCQWRFPIQESKCQWGLPIQEPGCNWGLPIQEPGCQAADHGGNGGHCGSHSTADAGAGRRGDRDGAQR